MIGTSIGRLVVCSAPRLSRGNTNDRWMVTSHQRENSLFSGLPPIRAATKLSLIDHDMTIRLNAASRLLWYSRSTDARTRRSGIPLFICWLPIRVAKLDYRTVA